MLGKLAAGGIAAFAGYKKLEGMESDDIRGIADKVTAAVGEFGAKAAEKADKLPFVKAIKGMIESNDKAMSAFQKFGSLTGRAGNAISDGFKGFMNKMADAKDAADIDKANGAEKSTFLKHAFEEVKDGAVKGVAGKAKSAALGAAGLLGKLSGNEKLSEAVQAIREGAEPGAATGLAAAAVAKDAAAEVAAGGTYDPNDYGQHFEEEADPEPDFGPEI